MLLQDKTLLCPSKLVARSFSSDVVSTADSFKSWDTCMDNKTCKIVAIVGIVLAVLFSMWIFQTVFRCLCMGVDCLSAMCCCCCRPAQQPRTVEQQVYNNPNMYGPTAAPYYTRQPQQAYFTAPQGYERVSDTEKSYYNDENPFEKSTSYRGNNY